MSAEDIALEQATSEITQTHLSLLRARHLVDELHRSVRSASRYLDDTELDAAKTQLCDPERRDRFLEAAVDGLDHVSARCRSGRDVAMDLVSAVGKAGHHLGQAERLTSTHPEGARYLTQQLEALRDLLAITEPIAREAFAHLDVAHEMASRAAGQWHEHAMDATALHQTLITVGHEVARADEDVRLADIAIGRTQCAASRTASLALEINDTARSRMAAEQQRPAGAGPAGGGYGPGR